MISLETFKKCMLAIQRQDEIDDQLTNLLVDKSTYGWVNTGEELINAMRALIKDSLNDQYDYIDWWIYDVNQGNKKVWDTLDDSKIEYDLEDLDSLYYYIIGEYSRVPQKKIKPENIHEDVKKYKKCSIDEVFDDIKEWYESE